MKGTKAKNQILFFDVTPVFMERGTNFGNIVILRTSNYVRVQSVKT